MWGVTAEAVSTDEALAAMMHLDFEITCTEMQAKATKRTYHRYAWTRYHASDAAHF